MAYRQIHEEIWSDTWFGELSTVGKLLFIYLFSNRSVRISGIYELNIRYANFETGIPSDKILSILAEFQDAKKIEYDGKYIWVKNLRRYNTTGYSPTVAACIKKDISLIPDCEIKRNYLEYYKDNNQSRQTPGIPPSQDSDTLPIPQVYPMDRVSIPPAYPMDTLSTPYPDPMREQEQEQEQEHNTCAEAARVDDLKEPGLSLIPKLPAISWNEPGREVKNPAVLAAFQKAQQNAMKPDVTFLPEYLQPHGEAFLRVSGLGPPSKKGMIAYWIQELDNLWKNGVSVETVEQAIINMRRNNLTIKDPGSIRTVAMDLTAKRRTSDTQFNKVYQ